MNARSIFERYAGPAPVEAPPKPTTKPDAPVKPDRTDRPSKHPNPFRRRLPNPGPMPRPKACSEAKQLFRAAAKPAKPAAAAARGGFTRGKSVTHGHAKPLGRFNFGAPKAARTESQARAFIKGI